MNPKISDCQVFSCEVGSSWADSPENGGETLFLREISCTWKQLIIIFSGANFWGTFRKILETIKFVCCMLNFFWGIHMVFPNEKTQQTKHHSISPQTAPFHIHPPQVRVNHHRCTIHAPVYPGLCEDLAAIFPQNFRPQMNNR